MKDVAAPKLYLEEWIDFRDLTLEEVAERSGISKTHVTQLKSGKRVWNQRVLIKLARGLDISNALALFSPPGANAGVDIWLRIPEPRRQQAQRAVDHVLEGFAEPAKLDDAKPKKAVSKKRK